MKYLVFLSISVLLLSCSNLGLKRKAPKKPFNSKELLKKLTLDVRKLEPINNKEALKIWRDFLKNSPLQKGSERVSHHMVVGHREQIDTASGSYSCPVKKIIHRIPLHQEAIKDQRFILEIEELQVVKSELEPQCMGQTNFVPEVRVGSTPCCASRDEFLKLSKKPFDLRLGNREDFSFYRLSENQILGKGKKITVLFNTEFPLTEYLEGMIQKENESDSTYSWQGWDVRVVETSKLIEKHKNAPFYSSYYKGKGQFSTEDRGLTLNDVMQFLQNPSASRKLDEFFKSLHIEMTLSDFHKSWVSCLNNEEDECFKQLVNSDLLKQEVFTPGDCDGGIASSWRYQGEKPLYVQYLSGNRRKCTIDWRDGAWQIVDVDESI